MNDKGKTVTAITDINSGYRSIRGRRQGLPPTRCIEVKLRLQLHGDYPGGHGFEVTMGAINHVTDRAINALANEFLP